MQKEASFGRKFNDFLDTLPNCDYTTIQAGSIHGIPDRIICIGGLYVAAELKRDKKQNPRATQRLKLFRIRKAGGISIVCYPENFELVKVLFQRLSMERNNVQAILQRNQVTEFYDNDAKNSALSRLPKYEGDDESSKSSKKSGRPAKQIARRVGKAS